MMPGTGLDPISMLLFVVPAYFALSMIAGSHKIIAFAGFCLVFNILFSDSPISSLYLICSIVMLAILDKTQHSKINIFLIGCHLGLFLYLKLFNTQAASDVSQLVTKELPLGLSYMMFLSLSLIVNRTCKPLSLKIFLLSFFPAHSQGPYLSSADAPESIPKTNAGESIWNGFILICKGLAMVGLASIFSVNVLILPAAPEQMDNLALWLLKANVFLFYNFWGFSEVVRGLGEIVGLSIQPNFNSPFNSNSLSEYWSKWHISLGGWFRIHVYFPLIFALRRQPFFSSTQIVTLATFCTFLLIGLWHDVNFKYVVWALCNTILVVFIKHSTWSYWTARASTLIQAILINGLFFSKDLPTFGALITKLPISIIKLHLNEAILTLICSALLLAPGLTKSWSLKNRWLEFVFAIITLVFSLSFNGLVSTPLYGRF